MLTLLNKNNQKVDKLIDLLSKTNDVLSAIEGNTHDSEKDVWYPPPSEPQTPLYVRFRVVYIGDIDTINQQFYCDLYMYIKWREQKLKVQENSKFIPWEQYFDPQIIFQNTDSYSLERRHLDIEHVKDEAPFIRLQYHIKGYFKEVLEVNDFPFDYQDLTISLMAGWRITDDCKVCFKRDKEKPDGVRTSNFVATQEWELQSHLLTTFGETQLEPGISDDKYPTCSIQMHVKRRSSHYMYNVVSVMLLITAMTFSSFLFAPDDLGDRLQIILTLLLTSVAFKYVTIQSLPKVSYLTFLDKYVLGCMFFQFMLSIQASVSSLLRNKIRDKFEWVSICLAITFFTVFHGICFHFAFSKRKLIENRIQKEK